MLFISLDLSSFSLCLWSHRKWPFILMTNGGGIHEVERCQKLSKEFGVPVRLFDLFCSKNGERLIWLNERGITQISVNQLVQSHTIFRTAARELGDKPLLVIGGQDDRCRKVAERFV
jgi:ribonucleotide monophosphatase NagD (HAD superfamily)